MADRKILTQISPTAWEHPADRAALQTLRAIPGFDDLVRKILGFFGERGIRQLFLANAVRIGPRQRPKLDALYTEVLETMDWPERPDLYVTQTPFANAGAVGFEKPFIVLNSGALALLDREEQRVILGHELGHIMSGHATYRTIALILLWIGSRNLPFLAGMALLPIELALFEWLVEDRQLRPGQRHGHGRAGLEVERAADDLTGVSVADVDAAHTQPVGVRMLLDLQHPAHEEVPEVAVDVRDAGLDHALDLE